MRRLISAIAVLLFVLYPTSLLFFALLSECSPRKIDLNETFSPPSLRYPLGRNELGQDIACMIGHGIITSVKISSITTLICILVGGILGTIAGYFGGISDTLISRTIEFFQGLPSLVFVIFIISVLGGGDSRIILSLSMFGWVSFARIARGETMRIKNLEFVRSAHVIGLPHSRILTGYILPFVAPSLMTQALFSFSSFMLAEGSLGFLGLRPADKISLGSMIADGVDFILTEPQLVIFPGMALTSISVLLNILGQHLITRQKGAVT